MSNWERQLEKINLKTADDEMLDFKRKSARIYKNLFKNTEEELLKLLVEIEENPTRSTLYEYKKYYEFRNKLIAQLDSLGVKINSSMTSNLENTYKKVQSNVNNLLPNAKEVPNVNQDAISAGYGIAYLYGVLGVVLFVQIVPKILKIDMAKERESFVAANSVVIPEPKANLTQLEEFGFFPFFLAVAFGCIIGAIEIPKVNFSLGNSGGTLVAGLIIGHFGRIGKLDCRISKQTLNFMRELGLVLFLIGAGIPGGVNFVSNVKFSYFIYGAVMTTVPMVVGYIIARYVFKLSIFNNLGSITGGMTSTPALGSLIATAGTDEVSSAYAATYPLALVSVVLTAKIIVMIL